MSNRQFLFVNKDAESSSLTRSSTNEQISINSYVQRGRRHRRSVHSSGRRKPKVKREEQPEKSDSNSSLSPSTSSTSSSNSIPIRATGFNTFVLTPDGGHKLLSSVQSDRTRLKEHGHDSANQAAVSRVQTAQQTSDDLIAFAKPEYDACGNVSSPGLPLFEPSPQGISQLAANPIDPFQNTSVKIDPQVHKLMQYYKLVYHPAVWHAETRASGKGKGNYIFKTSAEEVLRNAMQSSVDMYALLACMASRMEMVDQRPDQGTDEYLQRALSATRQLLSQRSQSEVKTNEQILMIIFHLYAAEGYRENVKAAKIHLKGAKTIIDCLGGLNKLRDPQMRELMIIGDGHLSAIMLEPCEFPCDFDPGSYHEATAPGLQISSSYDLTPIALAFRHPPRTLIPQEIYTLIEETAECAWVLQNAQNAPPEPSKLAMRWVGMRNLAIRHRLQGLVLTDPRLDALRVSLMLWILVVMTLLGLKRLGFAIAPKLRTRLKLADVQNVEWKGHYDVKVWILSLGAMCAATGTADEKWFVRNLAKTLAAAGMRQGLNAEDDEATVFDRLQQVQNTFFYHDPVQRPRLQRLAKLLMTASEKSQG